MGLFQGKLKDAFLIVSVNPPIIIFVIPYVLIRSVVIMKTTKIHWAQMNEGVLFAPLDQLLLTNTGHFHLLNKHDYHMLLKVLR